MYRTKHKIKETGSIVNRKDNRRKSVLNEDMLQDVRVSFDRSSKKIFKRTKTRRTYIPV